MCATCSIIITITIINNAMIHVGKSYTAGPVSANVHCTHFNNNNNISLPLPPAGPGRVADESDKNFWKNVKHQ